MAAMHPAVVWLIVAAVVGVTLLIATFFANRNRNKKKKGTFSIISSEALSLNSMNGCYCVPASVKLIVAAYSIHKIKVSETSSDGCLILY